MKDRFGRDRCDGYRQEDFDICPLCKGTQGDTKCKSCGGYGEVPKLRTALNPKAAWPFPPNHREKNP